MARFANETCRNNKSSQPVRRLSRAARANPVSNSNRGEVFPEIDFVWTICRDSALLEKESSVVVVKPKLCGVVALKGVFCMQRWLGRGFRGVNSPQFARHMNSPLLVSVSYGTCVYVCMCSLQECTLCSLHLV